MFFTNFFSRIGHNISQAAQEVASGAVEAVEKVEEFGELVETGLEKTLEFINVIKEPVQEIAQVGEVIGGILLGAAPFIPPPGNAIALGIGGGIEVLSLGLDKGIDLLNKTERKVKEVQDTIQKVKDTLEVGKELVSKHKDTIINLKNDPTKVISIVEDTTKYLETLKELQDDIVRLTDKETLNELELKKLEEFKNIGKTPTKKPTKKSKVVGDTEGDTLNDLTVGELKKLAKKNKIKIPTRILKADLIKLIEQGGVGGKTIKPIDTKKVKTFIELKSEEKSVDKMTVSELRALAKKEGIKIPTKIRGKTVKKAQILNIIKLQFKIKEQEFREEGAKRVN